MKNTIASICIALASYSSFCIADSWEQHLVNYNDCKSTLEGNAPIFKLDQTLQEEQLYQKGRICSTWAIATLIALQSAKAICTKDNYQTMQYVISYAYKKLPAEAGDKMVWSFADVAMAMYPCE